MFTLKKIRTSPYALLVTIPNGYKVKVIEIGNFTIVPNINLHKVLFVPLSCTLLFLFIYDNILNVLSHLRTLNVNCVPLYEESLEIGKVKYDLYLLFSGCLKTDTYVYAVKSSILVLPFLLVI